MRTHVIISDELIKKVDSLVGKRRRSRFVEEVIRERIKRETLLESLKETSAALSVEEHPEWETPEKVARWVQVTRQQDDKRIKRHG